MLKRIAVSASFAVLFGCGGSSVGTDVVTTTSPPITTQPVVTSIQITAPTQTLSVGATAKFTASIKDASGSTMANEAVVWASTSSAVATVDAFGTVTGIGAGTATIAAAAQSKPSVLTTVSVTVSAPITFAGTIYLAAARTPFAGGPSSSEILAIDPNTGAETNLTTNAADDIAPWVSSDGQYLAFQTSRYLVNGSTVTRQYATMRKDGTNVQPMYTGCQLYDGATLRYCATPRAWLADGRLLFDVDDILFTGGTSQFFATRAPATQAVQTFSVAASFPRSASIVPGGDIGIFTSGGALYAARTATGAQTLLMPTCAFASTCGGFTWSPTGSIIYAPRDGALVQVNIDGTSRRTIYTAANGSLAVLGASPDGGYLAFKEGDALKVLRLDGSSSPTTLASYVPGPPIAAWSPDSKAIAFGYNNFGTGFTFANQLIVVNVNGTGLHSVGAATSGNNALAGFDWGK